MEILEKAKQLMNDTETDDLHKKNELYKLIHQSVLPDYKVDIDTLLKRAQDIYDSYESYKPWTYVKYNKKRKVFIISFHVNTGYAGDWEEKQEFNPLAFELVLERAEQITNIKPKYK